LSGVGFGYAFGACTARTRTGIPALPQDYRQTIERIIIASLYDNWYLLNGHYLKNPPEAWAGSGGLISRSD